MTPATEYAGPPPLFWQGEDLADLHLDGKDVLAADALSALMGAKASKPATVKPLLVGGVLHVSLTGTSQWHWMSGRLLPLVPFETWHNLNPGRTPPHVPEGTKYDGVMVLAGRGKKAKQYVVNGPERHVRWLDPDAQRPPEGWTVDGAVEKERLLAESLESRAVQVQEELHRLEDAKRVSPETMGLFVGEASEESRPRVASGAASQTSAIGGAAATPSATDSAPIDAPSPPAPASPTLMTTEASKRTCEVCGTCAMLHGTATRCEDCVGMETWGRLTLLPPCAGCVVETWTHKDGRAVCRAMPGHLGNWHSDEMPAVPGFTDLMDAIGAMVGLRFGSIRPAHLEDGSGAIVLELHPPKEAPAVSQHGAACTPVGEDAPRPAGGRNSSGRKKR